jgi:ferrous iron transport protein A
MVAAVLSELGVGATATVTAVDGDGPVLVRLLEMGFVPGTPVHLVKVAPLGDPLQFRVRGYHISLRRAEAARIRVESS